MNSRFLASPGGRLANAALSLTFGLAAYASFANGAIETIHAIALGLIVIIATFIVAAILSVREFHWHTFSIAMLGPMVGFYYVTLLQLVTGAGPAVGSALATIGVFVLLTGIVLGLRTSGARQTGAEADRGHGHTQPVLQR